MKMKTNIPNHTGFIKSRTDREIYLYVPMLKMKDLRLNALRNWEKNRKLYTRPAEERKFKRLEHKLMK